MSKEEPLSYRKKNLNPGRFIDGVGHCLDDYYATIREVQPMAVEKSCTTVLRKILAGVQSRVFNHTLGQICKKGKTEQPTLSRYRADRIAL